MSELNVEIVRKAIAYEYDGVGDRAEAEAIFDPHVVMNPFHAVDEAPSYGPDAMRDDWERWASAFEDLTVTFEEFIDAGDQVVVVAHHQGRGRESGVTVDARYFEVYTLREGKVSQIDEYDDRAEALKAAGLSEQPMSQENVELVRQAEDAILRRDRDAWFAIHDEDFEIVPVRDWPEGGVRGREAGWDFHMRIRDSFEWEGIEVERVDAGADKVLAHLRSDLRGAGSGAEVELDQWFVTTVREGKILRLQWFTDGVEAREAAGLS